MAQIQQQKNKNRLQETVSSTNLKLHSSLGSVAPFKTKKLYYTCYAVQSRQFLNETEHL